MSDGTKIEWTDATVNVINGCSVVSPGCTNCYAMKLAGTRLKHHESRAGLTRETKAGPVWTGETKFHEPALEQVLRWQRPRRIFWNAHGDTFHESVPDDWIDRCFAAMLITPRHTHQVLTKRPERARAYLTEPQRVQYIVDALEEFVPRYYKGLCLPKFDWPLANVWLGTSVEDQQRADERVPILLDTPAAIRWLSMEPLLGPVRDRGCLAKLDWIVVGGESGPGSRPMHPDWARSIRDECAAAGVPFHFKQWGDWAPDPRGRFSSNLIDRSHFPKRAVSIMPDGTISSRRESNTPSMSRIGKKAAGRLLDGVEHNGYPNG